MTYFTTLSINHETTHQIQTTTQQHGLWEILAHLMKHLNEPTQTEITKIHIIQTKQQ